MSVALGLQPLLIGGELVVRDARLLRRLLRLEASLLLLKLKLVARSPLLLLQVLDFGLIRPQALVLMLGRILTGDAVGLPAVLALRRGRALRLRLTGRRRLQVVRRVLAGEDLVLFQHILVERLVLNLMLIERLMNARLPLSAAWMGIRLAWSVRRLRLMLLVLVMILLLLLSHPLSIGIARG